MGEGEISFQAEEEVIGGSTTLGFTPEFSISASEEIQDTRYKIIWEKPGN